MFNTQVATAAETRTNRIITSLAEMRDAALKRAERIDNTKPKRLDTMTMGDVARQGDVNRAGGSRRP